MTTCGLLVALSCSGKSPISLPTALGWKLTLIVQVLCADRLAPHELVCAKSPLTDIAANLTGAALALVTFRILGRLVVPTF